MSPSPLPLKSSDAPAVNTRTGFFDNNVNISNLLEEENGLHKAYLDLRTDATKVAFFCCHNRAQQRLREMQDAWMV
ncbi:unnamed protein product [Schistocephalus solidus]|uniref:Uncharacterized protein n=1 Tax=Schistocephalus solidus TaxID=70667 RepID=A0A183TA52_SCHSO|nr:unnamed protein product [Schistocephalus solidus]